MGNHMSDMTELYTQVKRLVEVLNSHDAVCMNCDRDGEKYCDCLEAPLKAVKAVLAEYVSLGDVCRNLLDMQCQYGSRYANTICKDLRILGDTGNYHSMKIHKDDVAEYVRRATGVLNHEMVE
jgi:hypothetical protein